MRVDENGVTVFVRLTPKASKNALEGAVEMNDGRVYLKARVRAVPEDGKANGALMELLAGYVGLPVRNLSIASGHTARLKAILIRGEPGLLAAKFRDLSAGTVGRRSGQRSLS